MALDSGIPDRNGGIFASARLVYNDESRSLVTSKIYLALADTICLSLTRIGLTHEI
jgi:hypothetical protein